MSKSHSLVMRNATSMPQHELHDDFQVFGEIIASKNLSPLFQPIVDLDQRTIYGYESLIRGPSDSPYHSPAKLFDIAIRTGQLLKLDLLCREVGITHFQQKKLPGKLFLNATPESLLEPGHRSGLTLEILSKAGIQPENVVIEMTEQSPMENFEVMRNAIEHYKLMGFKIAIDDLGAGYSGLRRWSEIRPDYVKIDKHFIQGIHEDQVKKSFVKSINDIAQGLGCQVIAEGIETLDEYRTIYAMGITLIQGYYFSRPQLNPPYVISSELFCCSSPRDCGELKNSSSENISELLIKVPGVLPDITLEEVHKIFHGNETINSIPVLDQDGITLGLVRRNQLLATFSTQYGRSLYGARSVQDFIDRSPVIVDKEWSFEQVSKFVTDNMQMQIEDDFVITKNGKFAGLGKVVQLLKKITDLQIRNARYANPLSMLPGNVPIYEKIDAMLAANNNFCIAYCDIDNFKPYNDVYGYAKGDKVIKTVAGILLQYVIPNQDFVGHVGGDDFILIFKSENWHQCCENILNSFEQEIVKFYTDMDLKNNGIFASARNGENEFYPVMSLSIGAVIPDLDHCHSYTDVAELASQAKSNAKNIPGNSLFHERRVHRD
jgi:EAL domain-containing protein (putative c-di-GMP-specific phosphodiesterase class I)/GGDEF domain-containing protein